MLGGRILKHCATRLASIADCAPAASSIGNGKAFLHSSAANHSEKKWVIPERLNDIPTAKDPNFFNMVEYFFHRACVLAEDSLVQELGNMRDLSEEGKRQKVNV